MATEFQASCAWVGDSVSTVPGASPSPAKQTPCRPNSKCGGEIQRSSDDSSSNCSIPSESPSVALCSRVDCQASIQALIDSDVLTNLDKRCPCCDRLITEPVDPREVLLLSRSASPVYEYVVPSAPPPTPSHSIAVGNDVPSTPPPPLSPSIVVANDVPSTSAQALSDEDECSAICDVTMGNPIKYYSPQCSPRSVRRRAPLKESRRVSVGRSGSFVQLNQYTVYESIGKGSFGVVKLAFNEEEQRHYAIKVLSKKKLMKRAGVFGRAIPRRMRTANPLDKVYREIAILKKLDHPNVVKLVEVLDDPYEDDLFLVFELLQREVMHIPADIPLTEVEAWSYFRDIILGLEYLHFQRIIHRDIKPSNLLLGKDLHVQIADLGVCTEFEGPDAVLNAPAGTPAFTAPEAIQSTRGQFSGKAYDIWSLGITLFAFVHGRLPFEAETIPSLHELILTKDLTFPTRPSCRPPISDSLKDLILQMLQKDPNQRITLQEIKKHSWVTMEGQYRLPTEEENCQLVTVSEDDVRDVLKNFPKLKTITLIKTMLKNHSFQNPFSGGEIFNNLRRKSRSHSAPGAYDWIATNASNIPSVSRPCGPRNPMPPVNERSASLSLFSAQPESF